MLRDIEEANRRVWEGHSHKFEDMTHVIGGIGFGLLMYSAVEKQARPLGVALVALSAALHLYAYATSRVQTVSIPVLNRLTR